MTRSTDNLSFCNGVCVKSLSDTIRPFIYSLAASGLLACTQQPVAGPDKTFASESTGTLEGAGAGAVVGFQVGAGAGPGAIVGAGFGAVAGAIHGMAQDKSEEVDLQIKRDTKESRVRSLAQETLSDHYKRRMELHPTRDIFPADLFFNGDSVRMCPQGVALINEIARINKYRLPYSRLIVASYAKSTSADSLFAQYLTERRAREFANQLVRAGIEPRRVETRAVIIDQAVLVDPLDNPTRYNQAIELIPIDR